MVNAIAEAETRLNTIESTEPHSDTSVSDAAMARLEVSISLPQGVGAAALEDQTVFVIARPAGSTARMPTAVSRIPATTWPLTVYLSDENSMAGQKLSALAEVDLEVQVSPSGQPGLRNATFVGELRGVSVGTRRVLGITIRAIAQ